MLALSNTDLIQILQAMIAVEKSKGGLLGKAIVVNTLQGIMGDSAFLDDVRATLARPSDSVK